MISGNPLNCDCNLRPLTNFYETVLEVPQSFRDIVCHSPESLADKPLFEIPDDNLNCVNGSKYSNVDLNPTPDIKFLEIFL